MVCAHQDIAHVVGVVGKILANPGKEHWEAVKWIFRYLRGTSKLCLCFAKGKPILKGCTDANIADDLDGKKSIFGYLFPFVEGAIL